MDKIIGTKNKRLEFTNLLIEWGRLHGRTGLPWQKRDCYSVWVSEVMLQQTQVETVKSYFLRFMAKFPNVQSLASSNEDEVLALWAGLGYYRRAKMLHAASKLIVGEFKGSFPRSSAELVRLPGVGRSTAAAILSLGWGVPAAILDGNVVRVLTRYFGFTENVLGGSAQKSLWAVAEELVDAKHPSLYTQSIMDMGATVCTPKLPQCDACPLRAGCEANKKNIVMSLPLKDKKKRARRVEAEIWRVLSDYQRVALMKNSNKKGVWQSMIVFPRQIAIPQAVLVQSWNFKHIFSHYDLNVNVELEIMDPIELSEAADREGWILHELDKDASHMALPAPVLSVFKKTKLLLSRKESNV